MIMSNFLGHRVRVVDEVVGVMEKDCVYVVWQKEQEKLLVVSVCSNREG